MGSKLIALIVIVLGIHQTGLVKLKFLNREKKVNIKRSKKSDLDKRIKVYSIDKTYFFIK